MGLQVNREKNEYEYLLRVHQEFDFLKKNIAYNGVGLVEHLSLGIEVEGFVLTHYGRPLKYTMQGNDPQITSEIIKCMIEFNSDVFSSSAKAFSQIFLNIANLEKKATRILNDVNKNIVFIGTMPCVAKRYFQKGVITEETRYLEIADYVHESTLFYTNEKNLASFLGVGAGLHLHLKTCSSMNPYLFAACQLIAPFALAISSNAPILFRQYSGISEARIMMFEQILNRRFKRVFFPTFIAQDENFIDWFAEILKKPHFLTNLNNSEIDNLWHLRLALGTIYPWIRPTIGFSKDGSYHLRFELRFFSSGPTLQDMEYNITFFVAVIVYYTNYLHKHQLTINTAETHKNFYQVIQLGIHSRCHWFGSKPTELEILFLKNLIPAALNGMLMIGISMSYAKEVIENILCKVKNKINGAEWQKLNYAKSININDMMTHYIKCQKQNKSIVDWEEFK